MSRQVLRAITEDELRNRTPPVDGIDLVEFANLIAEGVETTPGTVELEVDGETQTIELTDQLVEYLMEEVSLESPVASPRPITPPPPPKKRRMKRSLSPLSPKQKRRLTTMR